MLFFRGFNQESDLLYGAESISVLIQISTFGNTMLGSDDSLCMEYVCYLVYSQKLRESNLSVGSCVIVVHEPIFVSFSITSVSYAAYFPNVSIKHSGITRWDSVLTYELIIIGLLFFVSYNDSDVLRAG